MCVFSIQTHNLLNVNSQNLSNVQIEELHGDIERYLTLEQSDVNMDFWTVMLPALFQKMAQILTQRPYSEYDGGV